MGTPGPCRSKASAESLQFVRLCTPTPFPHRLFRERCVDGIKANKQRCSDLIEYSLAMVTGLNSKIGYDKASVIAKESARTGIPVRKLCMEPLAELGLTEAELTEALDPARMCAPNADMVGGGGG